jgi:ABC-type transport system substrate-binding protein
MEPDIMTYRISRRRLLSHTAAATALLQAGFLGEYAHAQSTSDAISIALAVRSSSGMNPQQPNLNGGDNWIVNQLYDTLVAAPPGRYAVRPDEFVPSLAVSWETSSDARTWTYTLRDGVKFHKGYGELTADDVVFTFSRHIDPSIVTLNKLFYSNIESVEATGPKQVRFVLKQPDPIFNATCISQLTAGIMCRKAFLEKGEGFNTDPIGTGPYQFKSVDRDRGINLEAFAEHFSGPPATPNLMVRFIADTTARTLAFVSGQVDMIEGVRAPGWIDTMRMQMSDVDFDMTSPGSFNFISVNLTRPPLDNLYVRQAFRYAIDNTAIAAAFGEFATPMVGINAAQFAGSVSKDELGPDLRYDPDPEKAKSLLAQGGYPDGVTIPCYVSQREDISSIMLMAQEQLRNAGITLDMQIIDHATFRADNRLDKNTLVFSSTSLPPVPTIAMYRHLSAGSVVKADGTGQDNFSHYGVAMQGIDDLLKQASDNPSFDDRVKLVKDMEKKVLADLPVLGIVTLSYLIARNKRVDLGFKVESGASSWSLAKARRVA